MKFGMVTPWRDRSWAIEAIFDMSPLTRDMGVGWGAPGGSKIMKNCFAIFRFFSAEYVSTRSELMIIANFNPYLLFLLLFF